MRGRTVERVEMSHCVSINLKNFGKNEKRLVRSRFQSVNDLLDD